MVYYRIRALREAEGLTQKQVAAYLNVAQRTYSGYENGTINISSQAMVELAYYYKTSMDYLLGLTDEKEAYPRKPRKLWE